jgi:putative hydrolase of the HAD superfamily
MIEAVIWDFGGVFTTSPFEAFARYERANELPADLIRRINSQNHLTNAWARFERAELDLDGFDKAFADEALAYGHYVPGKDIIGLLAGDFRPEMIEALRRIKTKFKTGCITNNVPSNQMGSADGRSLYAKEVMALFDHVIESAKTGIRKPDPRIYQMMCDALGVSPKACIFLDDLGVNLKPARAMGMETIKVESGPQAIAALEHLTGMNLHEAKSRASSARTCGGITAM